MKAKALGKAQLADMLGISLDVLRDMLNNDPYYNIPLKATGYKKTQKILTKKQVFIVLEKFGYDEE